MSTCEAAYTATTQTFPGYPGFQDANLEPYTAGQSLSVCMRQKYSGGAWGPWQFYTGTVVKSFRLNNISTFLGVGDNMITRFF